MALAVIAAKMNNAMILKRIQPCAIGTQIIIRMCLKSQLQGYHHLCRFQKAFNYTNRATMLPILEA